MSFLKKYTNLTAYNADLNKDFPNVSYLVDEDEMKWVKDDPTLIIATYDVVRTNNNKLLHNSASIEKMWIDGVLQPSIVTSYNFSTTGEHIVKYKLIDNTTIGDYCFFTTHNGLNYGGLKSIIIPSNVTTIGNDSIRECRFLESITFLATTPPTLYNDSSLYQNQEITIYVPAESVNAYKTAQNYSRYVSEIQAIPTT